MNRWNLLAGLSTVTILLALASARPASVRGNTAQATATHPVPRVCPGLESRVPFTAYVDCLANATGCGGWNELCMPNLPPNLFNRRKMWLDLLNPGLPYHPLANPVRFRCGCW